MLSMLNNKLMIFIAAFWLLGLGITVFLPATISAQSARDAACQGVALTGGTCDSDPNNSSAEGTINKTIKTVIDIFSVVVGVIAVIMIMVGGLKYITSSGDSNNVNGAKNTILYAVIGLVVVALAQIVVRFVLNLVD